MTHRSIYINDSSLDIYISSCVIDKHSWECMKNSGNFYTGNKSQESEKVTKLHKKSLTNATYFYSRDTTKQDICVSLKFHNAAMMSRFSRPAWPTAWAKQPPASWTGRPLKLSLQRRRGMHKREPTAWPSTFLARLPFALVILVIFADVDVGSTLPRAHRSEALVSQLSKQIILRHKLEIYKDMQCLRQIWNRHSPLHPPPRRFPFWTSFQLS